VRTRVKNLCNPDASAPAGSQFSFLRRIGALRLLPHFFAVTFAVARFWMFFRRISALSAKGG